MQERQSDGHFALTGHSGRRGSRFLIDLDLTVEFFHVVQAFFLAHQLDNRCQHRIGGSGRTRVGHRNLSLQFGAQQILPGLRYRDAFFLQQLRIGRKTEIPYVDSGPVSFGVFELGRNFSGYRRLVFFQQPFIFGCDKGISRSTPPDAGLGVVLFGPDPAEDFARTHPDRVDLDAGIFLKLLDRFGHVVFHEAAI